MIPTDLQLQTQVAHLIFKTTPTLMSLTGVTNARGPLLQPTQNQPPKSAKNLL